jgi:hypothetical protein
MRLAYDKYSITHGDLHLNNIIVMNVNRTEITYDDITDKIAVIIDYGEMDDLDEDNSTDYKVFITECLRTLDSLRYSPMYEDLYECLDRPNDIVSLLSKYIDNNVSYNNTSYVKNTIDLDISKYTSSINADPNIYLCKLMRSLRIMKIDVIDEIYRVADEICHHIRYEWI